MTMAMKKFEILNKICNNCKLTSKEKLVAYYFVYKSNQNGICYPSVNTIANHCGVSERTIQRATKKLQEPGYLNINKRDINGKQTSNTYKLILVDDNKPQEPEATLSIESVNTTKAIKMKVVALEDILMVNEKQELQIHAVQSTVHADSTSIADKDDCDILIKRADEIVKVDEEIKIRVSRKNIPLHMALMYTADNQGYHSKIDIQIMSIFCLIYRTFYSVISIYFSLCAGHILIIVNVKNKSRLYRYCIFSRRYFMSEFGVPP